MRGALIESVLAATRAKEPRCRLVICPSGATAGTRRPSVAVGHQMLEVAYYIVRDGTTYYELGADYFARRDWERTSRRSVKQLEDPFFLCCFVSLCGPLPPSPPLAGNRVDRANQEVPP
jgi:hypothetical protein